MATETSSNEGVRPADAGGLTQESHSQTSDGRPIVETFTHGGKRFDIIDARGKDYRMATRFIDKDSGDDDTAFFPALMSVVVRVDGEPKLPEYYDNLGLKTFAKILTTMTSLGFMSGE